MTLIAGMESSPIRLELVKKENLPCDTLTVQVDNGTIYYWDRFSQTQRLYVKWNGEEIEAKLPEDKRIFDVFPHGNSLYFESTNKICEVTFTLSDGIIISKLRDTIEGEKYHENELYTILRDGKTFVYRLWEDPKKDGILIDAPDELEKLYLSGVHRSKLIYVKIAPEESLPTAHKLSENIIVVETYKCLVVHTSDSSPFIYIVGVKGHIYVLDTVKLEIMADLLLGNFLKIRRVAGIRNGVFTANVWMELEYNLVTAQFPDEYVKLAND
ncbi:hypothetical protein PMAYCL1PPCAC_26906 [Pristionchus mayeri]|uniref:Uncharacterized protein n=1 Tax=Pristionchus mayeri TaxID=1317129 RepID=A0AAN5D5F2_9BILA|nr:hypothetical protein PMAYCL1PPCAC_26906 [Pristionchus mayeri]